MSEIVYDEYSQLSPIDPTTLNILGCFLTLMFIFGVIFNSMLLHIFSKNKELRNPLNLFVMAITLFNLLGCLFELPWVIHSNFAHRWTSSEFGCKLSAFLMFFIGCTSVHLMAAISFERFYIMYKPLNIRKINFTVGYVAIFICILCGLFWSSMPLVGWSYFTLEGGLVSCGVELKAKTNNVRSFIIAIFMFVFVIPFGLILITNLKLLFIVKNMPNMHKGNNENEKSAKRVAVQKSITWIMIGYVTGFVLSWAPYACISFYGAFISDDVPPIAGTVPAYFAKSSMVWSTIFYVLTNRMLRSKLTKDGITGTSKEVSSVVGQPSSKNTNTEKKNVDVSESDV